MNDRIVIDPAICHGKPVIRGTRMPVVFVLGSLAGGMSYADMATQYDLTEADLRAAMAYAAELVDEERHSPLPTGPWMRFLIDANMPRCALQVIQQRGSEALSLRDMGLANIPDALVAELAKRNTAVLLTRDFDFADIRNYPPAEFPGIIVLDLPDDAVAPQICAVLEAFLNRPRVELDIQNRLAIVRPGRVRFRPALAD
jgi:uncharacterized protein (DUF433 family)/predicted nuclease of predicted toxin-antitoxin system